MSNTFDTNDITKKFSNLELDNKDPNTDEKNENKSSLENSKTQNSDDENDRFTRQKDDSKSSGGWESLNLRSDLLKGIYSVGFEKPSAIQKSAIPHIASAKNLRAQAQSGTGKTGAFVIGSLQRINPDLNEVQCIVLTPTREIAMQNADRYEKIGHFMGINVATIIGGTMIEKDKDRLNRKLVHVVVGTPGRISHMIRENRLKTDHIKIFILDEADEMLRIGFKEEVREIFESIPVKDLQVCFFSATYAQEDLDIIRLIVTDPVVIDLRKDDQTLQGIRQFVVNLGNTKSRSITNDMILEAKVDTFIDIYGQNLLSQVMLFINAKRDAALIHKLLNKKGYPCDLISGDLTPEERKDTLDEFKKGSKRILVTSGLCKRGIDVQTLSIVICFDVPGWEEKNDFIHRVGRAGRYGKKGIAIHILTDSEARDLRKIADHFFCVIPDLPEEFNLKE